MRDAETFSDVLFSLSCIILNLSGIPHSKQVVAFFAPGCVYYLRDSSWILDLLNQNKERKSESGILCHGARYIALSINRFSSFGQFKIYKVYAAILYRKSEDVKFIGLQDAGSVRRMASECTELLLHWILAFYITCVA